MIDITTALVFGYKLEPDTIGKLQEIDEEKYFSMSDDGLLHNLSAYEESDTILGVTVMYFETESPFIFTVKELNNKLDTLSSEKYNKLSSAAKFFLDNNLLDTTITPQLYIINKIW